MSTSLACAVKAPLLVDCFSFTTKNLYSTETSSNPLPLDARAGASCHVPSPSPFPLSRSGSGRIGPPSSRVPNGASSCSGRCLAPRPDPSRGSSSGGGSGRCRWLRGRTQAELETALRAVQDCQIFTNLNQKRSAFPKRLSRCCY